MKLNILSKDEIEYLHLAILQVFEKTGIKVYSERALGILKEAGAEVNERDHQVKVPPYLVEESIRNAPKSVSLYGRNPNRRLKLERDNLYTVLGACVPYLTEPEEFRRVSGSKEYVAKATRVADALPNIHVVSQFCLAVVDKQVNRLFRLAADDDPVET